MKVTVLLMFDITPIVDGGTARYNALYTRLARWHDVTILVYDQKLNRAVKLYWLSNGLKVHAFGIDAYDSETFWKTLELTQRQCHDVLCISSYRFSEAFTSSLAEACRSSDVVIAAHPYLASIAFSLARKGSIKIYDSCNVELDAKRKHFSGSPDVRLSNLLLADVAYAERLACQEAHHVTAVSQGDAERFCQLYDIPDDKITIIPNGVNIPNASFQVGRGGGRTRKPPSPARAVFIGSAYGPNVDAYRRTRRLLHDAGFDGSVTIVGSIAGVDRSWWPPVRFSEQWLGFVSDDTKQSVLQSSDFALNLMFTGAGTNLKLFDYMAAGCLIVANAFGARGCVGSDWYVNVEDVNEMRAFLAARTWSTEDGRAQADNARDYAVREYDWDVISKKLDAIITA